MYTLMRNVGLRKGLITEAPSLIASMVVAELFYKFHSFTLECGAFLATWFAMSYLAAMVSEAWSARKFAQRPELGKGRS